MRDTKKEKRNSLLYFPTAHLSFVPESRHIWIMSVLDTPLLFLTSTPYIVRPGLGVLVVLATIISKLDGEAKGQFGKLAHVVKVDMCHTVVVAVDERTDVGKVPLNCKCSPVPVLDPRCMVRAYNENDSNSISTAIRLRPTVHGIMETALLLLTGISALSLTHCNVTILSCIHLQYSNNNMF